LLYVAWIPKEFQLLGSYIATQDTPLLIIVTKMSHSHWSNVINCKSPKINCSFLPEKLSTPQISSKSIWFSELYC